MSERIELEGSFHRAHISDSKIQFRGMDSSKFFSCEVLRELVQLSSC